MSKYNVFKVYEERARDVKHVRSEVNIYPNAHLVLCGYNLLTLLCSTRLVSKFSRFRETPTTVPCIVHYLSRCQWRDTVGALRQDVQFFTHTHTHNCDSVKMFIIRPNFSFGVSIQYTEWSIKHAYPQFRPNMRKFKSLIELRVFMKKKKLSGQLFKFLVFLNVATTTYKT